MFYEFYFHIQSVLQFSEILLILHVTIILTDLKERDTTTTTV